MSLKELAPMTRRTFIETSGLGVGALGLRHNPFSSLFEFARGLYARSLETLSIFNENKTVKFSVRLSDNTTFTPQEVFSAVRTGITSNVGRDLTLELANRLGMEINIVDPKTAKAQQEAQLIAQQNEMAQKNLAVLLAPFVKRINDKGPSFEIFGFRLGEPTPPTAEIEIPTSILGKKISLPPEDRIIVQGGILQKLKEQHSNIFSMLYSKNEYNDFENGINRLATIVTKAIFEPEKVTIDEFNQLKNLLPRNEVLIKGINAFGYQVADTELLELIDTGLLAKLMNEMAMQSLTTTTDYASFFNRISCETLTSLLFSKQLDFQVVKAIFNARRNQAGDAKLFLLANRVAEIVYPQTANEQKLKLSIANDALAVMTGQILSPRLEDKPDALYATMRNMDITFATLWTNFLLEIGQINPEKLIDISALAESPTSKPFGLASRYIFQELRNRALAAVGQDRKNLFSLVANLENIAWNRFIGADFNENYSSAARRAYQAYFSVWSAIFTSRGSLDNYSADESKPDLSKLIGSSEVVQNKLRMSLNDLPVELLLRQLKNTDALRTISFMASLFNEPKSYTIYTKFFHGLVNYLENLPGWTTASDRARILSSLFDTVPVAAGILITRGLSAKSLTESLSFLNADELRKTVWASLMYQCIDTQRPFGAVTFSDYESQTATGILNESLDPKSSSHIMQALFAIDDINILRSLATDVVGKEKTFEDFSKFFTRKFWPRFTNGRLTYRKPPLEMKDALKIAGSDFLMQDNVEQMELNRVMSVERFLNDFTMEIRAIGLRNEEKDFKCEVAITRRDGKLVTDTDAGTFRNRFGDFVSFITLGAIQFADNRYKEQFEKIKNGQTMTVYLSKATLLNPALLDSVDAYAIAILAQALHHTDGRIYLQPDTALTLYDFDIKTNTFKPVKKVTHSVGLGPLDIDLVLPHGGDQKGYLVYRIGNKFVVSLTDPDGSGAVRFAYAEDVYTTSKIVEQIFRTTGETIVAITGFVAIEEAKIGAGRFVIAKILEALIH